MLGHWIHVPTLPFLGRSQELKDLLLLILCWARRRGNGELVHANADCHLCSQWPLTWCPLLSMLKTLARQKPISQIAFLNLRILDIWPSLLFCLPWEKLWVTCCPCQGAWRRGLWWLSATHFPTSFDTAGFMFAWDAGASQLDSGFVAKLISLCIVVESMSPWEEGGSGASYSAILLLSLVHSSRRT